MTVLVTGIGAPGTPGTVQCLRKDPFIRLIGCDMRHDPIGAHLVDALYRVPPPETGYIDQVLHICEREGVDVILPQTTAEVEYLSRTKRQVRLLETANVRVACSNGFAVKRANDKAAVMGCFRDMGLPAPKFTVVDTLDDLKRAHQEYGPKYVVKPRKASGSRGVRIVSEEHRPYMDKPDGRHVTIHTLLRQLDGDVSDMIVMEYLPGPEYSVDCFRGKYVKQAVPRIRKETRTGICTHAVVDLREDMMDMSMEAAKHLSLWGAFGFQYRLEKGVPKVIECNPRVQGTMVASMYAGLNAPLMAVREAMGDHPEGVTLLDMPVEYRRTWGGVGYVDGMPVYEVAA